MTKTQKLIKYGYPLAVPLCAGSFIALAALLVLSELMAQSLGDTTGPQFLAFQFGYLGVIFGITFVVGLAGMIFCDRPVEQKNREVIDLNERLH